MISSKTASNAQKEIQNTLIQRVCEATARMHQASANFNEVIDASLTLPLKDDKLRRASRDLNFARTEMKIAHQWLKNYLCDGTIPEDLDANSGE